MRVVTVPHYLDDRSFESVIEGLQAWPPEDRVLFDARGTKWASPYGFTGLLCAAEALKASGAEVPRLALPESDNVRSYWAKAGFLAHAVELFEVHGKVPRRAPDQASDVLLPITAVRGSEDVHDVVGRIQEHSTRILTGELHLEHTATLRFSMTLSEACQNVVEHAGSGGWVAVHAYNWRRISRRVVVIAVCDAGIGFRASLEPTEGRKYGDRWSDGVALESALINAVSRFPDPGRGQGLAAIKRYVAKWHGSVSIRSGTAKLSVGELWNHDSPVESGQPFFPGAQVQVVIPAQEPLKS